MRKQIFHTLGVFHSESYFTRHKANLIEKKNKLEWVYINDDLLDNSKFAGNYNIPHIIKQIKVYLKNGTGIDRY